MIDFIGFVWRRELAIRGLRKLSPRYALADKDGGLRLVIPGGLVRGLRKLSPRYALADKDGGLRLVIPQRSQWSRAHATN